jgi:hypothetical protein
LARVTTYCYLLTLSDRKRHEHTTIQGKVVRFVVQYETFVRGAWRPVVRYDTAHGFPHVDRISPNGSVEKIPLLTAELAEALTVADQDIEENWERYKTDYLKESQK